MCPSSLTRTVSSGPSSPLRHISRIVTGATALAFRLRILLTTLRFPLAAFAEISSEQMDPITTSFKINRQDFFQRLRNQADYVVKVESTADNKLSFSREKSTPVLQA